MARKIQFRRGTAASWTSTDPTLAIGELGLETDTGKMKIGDGVTAWSARPYIDAAAVAHIAASAGAHAAAAIANTPAGTIAATTVQGALNELDTEKAPLASPALTGTPTAPTAATATNTTQVATTAFVKANRAEQAAADLSQYQTVLKAAGGDESARIVAALAAFDATAGGVLTLVGAFSAANMTIPNRQNLTIDMSGATITKNANGPVFTTPGSGYGTNLTFINPQIDCNGATYTGSGIVVGASSGFMALNGGYIINSTLATLDFSGADGGGAGCDVNGTRLTVYLGQSGEANQNVATIKLPVDATTAPNRGFRGVRSFGCILVEDPGSQDSRFTDCVARNVNMTGESGKFFMQGCRLASGGADVTIRGTQGMFVGNAFAGNLLLGGTMTNSTVSANVVAGNIAAGASTSLNIITGNRSSTGVITDAGINNVIIEGKVPRSGYKTGQFYGIKGNTSSTRSYTNNRGFLAPMWIRGPVTFDRFCMEITSAGGAGTVFRGGVWATGTDGLPGALIYDVGASGSASSVLGNGFVDGTSVTAQTVTISLAFTAPQLVWVGAVMQSGSGSPVIRALLGGTDSGFVPDAASGPVMGVANSLYYDSLSGALATLVGVSATYSQTAPALALRAA